MGNKTKLQMRTDLATDLKVTIDTELSVAELNRSIERAYSDLSRFLPDEKIFEDSLQFDVTEEEVVFPADTSLDAVVKDENLQTAGVGSTAQLDGQPDMPRPLTATITDPNLSINGMVITINGTDKDDQGLQETFGYIRGDSKTIVGKKYFKNVLQVDFVQLSGGGPGDLLDIGYGVYTDVWVYLANSPIRRSSDSATNDDDSDAAVVKNTDYYIDYANGGVKAIAATTPGIDAGDTCTFAYGKSQIGIDISDLPDLIRVQRVEYPVGEVPQTFVSNDVFGKYVFVTGTGESGEQARMAEDQQYRIYYDAKHQVAGEYSPGTELSFLTDTVLMAAGAYALYILALKQEHQTATDIASARTALGNATGTHSALALVLADVEKYLNANADEDADAAGILKDITTDAAKLRTRIDSILSLANTYLFGDTAPSAKKYLDDGDATLNTVATGGEGAAVPLAYADYARASMQLFNGLIAEATQRINNLRTYIEQAAGYNNISNTFAREAEVKIAQITSYLQQASQYVVAGNSDIALADRFRAEADERRNEVYSIWRDRKQYIGDFTAGSVRQMPDYR